MGHFIAVVLQGIHFCSDSLYKIHEIILSRYLPTDQ